MEGCPVAKRNRYREMESLMTKVILADAFVFVLYMVFAARDMGALKIVTAIISLVVSGLSLAWLYITGEFPRRRSLWMITGFVGIIVCLLVSLLLGFPGPSLA